MIERLSERPRVHYQGIAIARFVDGDCPPWASPGLLFVGFTDDLRVTHRQRVPCRPDRFYADLHPWAQALLGQVRHGVPEILEASP